MDEESTLNGETTMNPIKRKQLQGAKNQFKSWMNARRSVKARGDMKEFEILSRYARTSLVRVRTLKEAD